MGRRKGEREIYLIGACNESGWDRQRDPESDALSSESLGTTHCCHYIILHYIRQPLHLWSCGRAQNQWLSLSAAAAEKNSSSFRKFSVMLFPLLTSLPFAAVFKATCVTLNLTKSVWSKAEVFYWLLWQWERKGRVLAKSVWVSAASCLIHFTHAFCRL